jgi:hypothetical protein
MKWSPLTTFLLTLWIPMPDFFITTKLLRPSTSKFHTRLSQASWRFQISGRLRLQKLVFWLHSEWFEPSLHAVYSFNTDQPTTRPKAWASRVHHAVDSSVSLLLVWRCYLTYCITLERLFSTRASKGFTAVILCYISKKAIHFWRLSNVNWLFWYCSITL